eukprot:1373283-Lingulodinium_polyedra.AAC.1
MEAALAEEEAMQRATHVSFVIDDLYKAFDRVVPLLLHMALLRAGMPAPVFRAYAGFHRGLQ